VSTRVHSRYRRQLADLPVSGWPVEVMLTVRRFFCDRTDCTTCTFVEQVRGLTEPHARRSPGLPASESDHPHHAGEVYRLVTPIGDPDAAPAGDLAGLYAQRWEIESVFDEIKTHQQDSRPVLRSRDPDGVIQEIWGILLLHHAIRDLIQITAHGAGMDPDRVSFTRALRASRRQVSDHGAGLSPSRLRRAARRVGAELLERLNKRRRRHNPRVVRQAHRTRFPVKQPTDRHIVQPPPDLIHIAQRS